MSAIPATLNQQSGIKTLPRVSVIILTFNEEANLPACVQSIADLDCEVFVVDSGSSDRTVDIARAHKATVVEHAFDNYADQRNWAQCNLPIRSEWVLHLDADERLTPELVKEIEATLGSSNIRENGFLFRKRTIFMGRWIKHGGHYPSYHLRLFRKGKGRCEQRLYDQHFLVDGSVGRFSSDYLDIVASNCNIWTLRHARWASLEAEQTMLNRNDGERVRPDLLGSPIQRRRWLREDVYGRAPLFIRPFAYWFYRYVLTLGFLDGVEGLIFHFLQGCWFRFLVDATMYERQKTRH